MNRFLIIVTAVACSVSFANASARKVPILPGDGASQVMARAGCNLGNISKVVQMNGLKRANNYWLRLDWGTLKMPDPCPVHPSKATLAKSRKIFRQADAVRRHSTPIRRNHHHAPAPKQTAAQGSVQKQTVPPAPAQPQVQVQYVEVAKYSVWPIATLSGALLLALISLAWLWHNRRKLQEQLADALLDQQELQRSKQELFDKYQQLQNNPVPSFTFNIGAKTWQVTPTGSEIIDGIQVWICHCPWGAHPDETPCHENHLHVTNIYRHLIEIHDAQTEVTEETTSEPMPAAMDA